MKELLELELAEKLNIQKSLAGIGYFAYKVKRPVMGNDNIVIHAKALELGKLATILQQAEQELVSLGG